MAMTLAEKMAMVKAILRITDDTEDALITTYLTMASRELLGWRYSYADPANVPEDVPDEYEMTQVMAVVVGYTQSGVEGELTSIENGIHRHFEFSDMVRYIRANVIPIAGIIRKTVTPEPDAAVEPDVPDESGASDSEGGDG